MEYIKFYNMPHYYILLTSQVINCTWLGIVRDSCWFDPSFASCRTDLTKDWELLGPEFILAPLSKMYNNKEEEPEIHRLAIYPQQCSGAWSEYGTHFFQFIQEAQMLLCCQYLIFPFFLCSNLSAQPVPLCERAVHPPEAAVWLLSGLHRRLWWAHVWWEVFSWHSDAVLGHVLHPCAGPWSLQSNILSGKSTSEGPSELSLGKPCLTVLSTLELGELLLNLEWLFKMCSPIHCNNRAKLEANYVEELTCNEQVSTRDHKPVSYNAGVKRIYGEMLIFLGKM